MSLFARLRKAPVSVRSTVAYGPLQDLLPLCLGTIRHGQPRHLLYVADGTPLVAWTAP